MKLKNKGRVSSDTLRKAPPRKLNPFEIHINRSKHQVLGRQLKSERGLPGVSKNKALMKRKSTLLHEYKIRGKSNQFIDQRIGERNKNMTEDDRIMARFAAERMRSFNKKAMFNLSDTEVLTHKGQTLSEIERYEQTRSDDEDEDDEGRKSSGTLKGKFVENAHFGGGMLKTSKQDRESLIDQLINESKKRKAERQRNKEETLEATEQLDEEWKNLGVIVTSNKNTDEITQKKDQYDIVMRQLKFEPHGQASQRLKTEEEIAKEDKEQLEKLEKERLKQLREIEFNKYGSHKSADDLDDGFSNCAVELTENDLEASDSESSENLSNSAETESENEEDEEEEADEENKEENEKSDEEDNENNASKTKRKRLESAENMNRDGSANKSPEDLEDGKSHTSDVENGESTEEESSEDECAMDDFTDLMPSVSQSSSLSPQEKNPHQTLEISKVEAQEELNLPFVFEFPDSFSSFKGLLKSRSVKQQKAIFERLIKSNHPSLDPGNKRKMLTLAEFIIELVSNGDISWASLPVLVSQFNLLKEFNKEECLKKIVNSLSTELKELTDETSLVSKIKYLTWYIFVFLRPQGLDVLVPVGQPVLNLACRLLTQNYHVTLSLLCCSLLLQDAKHSSILYPEAVSFLSNCINRISSKEKQSENKQEQAKSNNRDKSSIEYQLILDFETEVNDDLKILYCSVLLLIDFVKVYRKYPQSKLMFKSVNNSVCSLKAASYPPTLKKEISELQTLMKVLDSARLPSLAKSTKKPKALRQYEPSFYTVTVGKSVRGLPAEKQEEQKLLHKYKHEMKGAMRELRRDRVFLANVKLKEKALSDEQRIKKVKEIFSSAATQQGELRRLKRKK